MHRCIRTAFIEAALFTSSTRALSALLKTQTQDGFRNHLSTNQRLKYDQIAPTGQLQSMRLKELKSLEALGARYVTPLCSNWPAICTSPALFRIMGVLEERKRVAIIGARNASRLSRHRAWALGSLLAFAGKTVVSGGALGVDIEGLQGANGLGGSTLTVLGSGLLNPTPRQHIGQFQRLLEKGAILSEFTHTQKPTRWSFVRRNRWISELSNSVVVMQASSTSGALTAARRSLSLKRRVFVDIPMSQHPDYAGCVDLLEEGAECLSVLVGELLDEIEIGRDASQIPVRHAQVLDSIGTTAIHIENLSEHLDLGLDIVLKTLIELECDGSVERDEFGRWFRRGLFANGGHGWWSA